MWPLAALLTGGLLIAYNISTTALTYAILAVVILVSMIAVVRMLKADENLEENKQLNIIIRHYEENKPKKQGISQVIEDFSTDDYTPGVDMVLNK